ncbi:MAG: hypothetical protein AAGB02_04430 [Pseudomonadota bacterium]
MATASAQNGPIGANALISNPGGVINNFDVSNFGPILTELGMTWEERSDGDSGSFIIANFNNQINFNIMPQACLSGANAGCVGAAYVIIFTDVTPNHQTVTAFNQKSWFASAGRFSDGPGVYISRYEIADYGIFRGNVASSLISFLAHAQALASELESGTRTVSLEGFADDMASNHLNRVSLDAIAGQTLNLPKTAYELHQASFDEAPVIIRELAKSDKAAVNKITNTSK